MTYNGWSNYETWVTKLWMDNEEPSYRYWGERVADIRSDEDDRDTAIYVLADALKDEHEEALPELEGFASDLLRAAFGEVDWREIAESMIADYDYENPPEVGDDE